MRLEDLNLRNPITIAYYDPFSVFPSVLQDFLSKFPLANLLWKYHPRKPGKSIPLLPVNLKEEIPPPQHKRNANVPLVDNVYLRLMFVRAENMEMYRSQVRPLIGAWLQALVKDRNVTWAIILVSPRSLRDRPSTLIKTSIIDKLKIDFGKSGKQMGALNMVPSELDSSKEEYDVPDTDNIFRIKEVYSNELQKVQEYNEIVTQMKTLILQTFDWRYNLYNDKMILLLSLTLADSTAQVAEFQCKLKLVYMMGDMRFLKELLDLYNEASTDLKALLATSDIFDRDSVSLPADLDLNSFSPETTFDQTEVLVQFARYAQDSTPVNLFTAKLGILLGKSLVLQSLANFATSISISAIYVLTLLLNVNFFINDVSRSYPDSVWLNEWLCAMIDFYLDLPLTSKLIELDAADQDKTGPSRVSAIKDCMAELRLLRRTIVGKLAAEKGLEPPQIGFVLEDISLGSEKEESGSFKLTYSPLVTQLHDQSSYEDYFEAETIAAIEDFVSSDRTKTIDLLSVDLAILSYRRKKYAEALEILLTSHDYFIENGWNFMGGALLEIYLECIQKLNTVGHDEILQTNLKLLAALKGAFTTTGINNYNLIRSLDQRHALFERVCEESEHLEKQMSYPLSELFDVSVCGFIETASSDEYSVLVILSNCFATKLHFLEIRVTLESPSGPIVFSASAVEVSSEPKHTIALTSRIFRKDTFHVKQIEIQVTEKLRLVDERNYVPSVNPDSTVVYLEDTSIQPDESQQDQEVHAGKDIAMYPVPGNFRAEVISPARVELGVARFDLALHTGQKDARNIGVSLGSLTHGVRFDQNAPKFELESIEANSALHKGVTFSYYGDTKILDLQIDILYESDGKVYEYHTSEEYDMGLIISILVQDIFRASAIYPKFLIGCASLKHPVRIKSCTFESRDENYEISCLSVPMAEGDSLVVYGDQPAFMFYRVKPKKEKVSLTDVLDLSISYSGLQQECTRAMEKRLEDELRRAGLEKYYFLLLPTVSTLRYNLNHYAVTNEIEVLNVDECCVSMNLIVANFVPEHDSRVLMDLVRILGDPLAVDGSRSIDQQLYIPVSVPILGMFHQVEFVFDKKQRHLVGEPIEAQLEIKSTSKWSSHELQEICASSSPISEVPPETSPVFQFTVLGEDQWLLSGFKKHQFSVKQGTNSSSFDVCLVPLSVGELQLPRVVIKQLGPEEINMEVVHENALETVLVVPELDSMRFAF